MYTNANSMTKKEEEPEVPAHKGDFNIVSLTETVGELKLNRRGGLILNTAVICFNCYTAFAM